MGKKSSWISAIKRLFNQGHKKSKEKGGRGGGGRFFPLFSFREPSSIEQILGEVDLQHAQSQSQSQSSGWPPPQRLTSPPRITSPPPQRLTSPPRITSPPPPPQSTNQHPKIKIKTSHTPEATLQQHHLSATRIQAAYRGYMSRRKTRGLTGLVRLQRVVASKSVKRQTMNAMKQMQLLVRVQTQIQSRRIQMLNQALKPQPNEKKPHKQSDERWDNSLITKEEREARLQRKADAAIKRERAMAYASSHQKETSTSAHKMGGYPWWWKWLEHQMPYHATPTPKNEQFATTPSRSTHKQLDTPTSTPMSSRSTKGRKRAFLYPMKDDDSLRSCPPFSVPNYMSPTASARAKSRPASNPKERCTTPASERRFSFPSTPNSSKSLGDFSMDSSVGRKPFNRFV